MGFLDDMFKGDKKKNSNNNNNNNNGIPNPFANFGGPRAFHGGGQSLGGSKPGVVIPVALSKEGPLGVRVEKRPNSDGSAIVNEVVPGSQAEEAGLKRGDILCFAGSNGQEEIMYDMFLELAKSETRPIHLEVRRIEKVKLAKQDRSADTDHRRQAVIAAAEAREKAHKAKSKPIRNVTKSTLLKNQNSTSSSDINADISNEPKSEQAKQAAALAKQGEAALAAQLGYNPYETARSTAGQARVATTETKHGSIDAGVAGSHLPTTAAPPRDAAISEPDPGYTIDVSIEFEEAFTMLMTSDNVKESCGILKKLIVNATTKGQAPGQDSAKFRKVRLANPKIQSTIAQVQGATELLLSVGFSLQEQDGESLLIFPEDSPGPEWLSAALHQLEHAGQ